MAFGIGTNTETPVIEEIRGIQVPIACECWFDSKGQGMPRLFKYQDETGQVFTVRNIRVRYLEEKNYAGVSSREYDCEIMENGIKEQIKLIFFMEHCRWIMVMPHSAKKSNAEKDECRKAQ